MDNKRAAYAKRSIIALAAFAIILAICLTSGQTGQYDFSAGEISTADVYAPRAVVDKTTTNALREAAIKSVSPAYKLDNDLSIAAVERLNEFFAVVTNVRANDEYDEAARAIQIKARSKLDLSDECCEALATMSDTMFSRLKKVVDCVETVMEQGVDTYETGLESCRAEIDSLKLDESVASVADALAQVAVTVNLTVDEAETENRQNIAASEVAPVEYKKNQTLVRRGEIITQAQIDMMSELGLLKGSSPISRRYTVGIVLLLLLCFGIVSAYIAFCDPKLGCDASRLVIVAVMSVAAVAAEFYIGRYMSDSVRAILPIGVLAAVITIFADEKLAILINMCVSMLGALGVQHDWGYGICLIVGGSITAFCFGRVKRRVNLIPASIISSFGYAFSFAGMALLETEDNRGILMGFGMGFLGGFLSGIITAGVMPFIEWGFDVLTPMKLYELSNPESKILRRLLVQAPGTYHHSLTVANLSEIAARAIGADSVLARVGAYYHDIGKINHPLYFKENQYNENPHDHMTYEESARVIINHVRDGIELANQYRLPKGIRDIIAQHHGTTNTGYFYKRALAENPDCDASLFTYEGPKPQSREAAIIMLCDCCEAAVRSLSSKDEAGIEKMVHSIIDARVQGGQLNECDLTFGQLEVVTETIIKTLGGYFHERIQY